MLRLKIDVEDGFVISLSHLREAVQSLNSSEVHWSLKSPPLDSPISDESTPRKLLARVEVSNPGFSNLPNDLQFLFPIVQRPESGAAREDEVFICLHPETATMDQPALYFERGRLKEDPIYDWSRFWPPLKKALNQKSGQKNRGNAD